MVGRDLESSVKSQWNLNIGSGDIVGQSLGHFGAFFGIFHTHVIFKEIFFQVKNVFLDVKNHMLKKNMGSKIFWQIEFFWLLSKNWERKFGKMKPIWQPRAYFYGIFFYVKWKALWQRYSILMAVVSKLRDSRWEYFIEKLKIPHNSSRNFFQQFGTTRSSSSSQEGILKISIEIIDVGSCLPRQNVKECNQNRQNP